MRVYRPSTPPTTPIGERITHLQDDPSFLQLNQTPISPIDHKTVRRLPFLPGQNVSFPELTSLSPPPRRGSRRHGKEVEDLQETPEPTDDHLISLSQHGSVISLGIVSM
jgi:hypothetical protein